jgi:hypothetical protein
METNSDAFFAMGKSHMVCQDYARFGKTRDGLSYAVVCDGCSSSPDTDFGARLLAVAAETQMQCGVIPSPERTVEMLRCNVEWLGLSPQCFDATMVAALQEPDGVRVRMWGDGVVVAQRRDGKLEVHLVEHLNNAPTYLSYDLDERRRERYLEKFGNLYKVSTCTFSPFSLSEEPSWSVFCSVPAPLRDWVFDTSGYASVAVMTDGANSFQVLSETETSKHPRAIPLTEVLRDLLAFKSLRGSFVQRRCHKFLLKECPTRLWDHVDDLAVGVVSMGPL